MNDSVSRTGNVTLEEIARAAGVSPSTVSRILNGTARVSDAKQQAVEKAIAEFQYQPNVLARSLASGRTHTIGVLTQAIASPFYGEWLRGIEDTLREPGLTPLFVSSHWSPEEEAARLEQLLARRVDGVIVLHGQISEDLLVRYSARAPLVVLGRSLAPRASLACLPIDNEAGARDATEHLLGLGHRHIAFVAGPPDHGDSIERLVGYRSALADAGVAFDESLVVQADFTEAGGFRAMERLLDAAPHLTAVFCSNDQMAYGARLVLYRRGIRVPEDVSLVGFDDLPTSVYMTPPLTTVRQPTYEIGCLAARAVVQLIRGETVTMDPIPLTLEVRETTQSCAARPALDRASNTVAG
ncbi:LacI family DNA-binding transcriptional regulator [Pararobbsia silviterrae]|uniref:LacI family transcriptional regulator n=1 Tax=Pararobbsia silviterrae TaxID=1792498 RepID=A0A494Y7I8_9BURK|nr:LacI family DNA-binding transcriptional regulator [Pararobbsia silviterrae]RKP58614.1 LacI family transcriptional regulator [Pararobbsia silviterrae]